MKKIAFIVILACFVLPLFSYADQKPGKESIPAKVPFQLLPSQHMVVLVKCNGKGPYRLIFDTGAPVTLLTTKVAQECNVLPKNFRRPLFAPFDSFGQFTIDKLEIEGLKANKVPVLVMNHPALKALSQETDSLEGIVGLTFFGRYRFTLDYQAKEMTFVAGSYEPPDMMDNMMRIMLDPRRGAKKVLSPAGQWGFRIGKEAEDKEAGVEVKEVFPRSAVAAEIGRASCRERV